MCAVKSQLRECKATVVTFLWPSNEDALLRNSDQVCPSTYQILDTLTVSDSDEDVEKARKLAEQVLMREEAEGHFFIRTSMHLYIA